MAQLFEPGPGRPIPRLAGLLLVLPAVLGLVFGLHLLPPSVMTTWCTTRRGCGGVRLWEEYPAHFPAIALAIGIAFGSMSVIIFRPAWATAGRVVPRLLGLGAVLGFMVALYWIAALRMTDGVLGPVGFYAPIAVLVLGVVPIEIGQWKRQKA
jgi:hypothetical protein